MFQTPVKPRCTYADDVEFDTVLFEPAGHDSDNEDHLCCDEEEELVIEDGPNDLETMQFLGADN
ncbi:hypothetical protein BDA96_09G072000 [Sorghum bicolor]|uniref:Uncharacterized protein n=2 Tax=Sorghum bicolor TaxID=4558 RepID=A0A921U3D1_SORBI|nr:hypothetical protein BDA96_09G072000 [Sorghum bicolor]OQU77563.1 hypothetical protein SORBI_3009G068350 [Sorghum bicolor]